MVFRVFRNKPKPTLKLIHTTINVVAFIFALLGLLAVYVNHNQAGYGNFYTLHSWMGLVAVILYFIQVSGNVTICIVYGRRRGVCNMR